MRKRSKPVYIEGLKQCRICEELKQPASEYFEGCCAVCCRSLNGVAHRPAGDHWIPLNKGGGTTRDNIIPLCDGVDGCNQSKADKDAYEWLIDRFDKRTADEINKRVQAYFAHVMSRISKLEMPSYL